MKKPLTVCPTCGSTTLRPHLKCDNPRCWWRYCEECNTTWDTKSKYILEGPFGSQMER